MYSLFHLLRPTKSARQQAKAVKKKLYWGNEFFTDEDLMMIENGEVEELIVGESGGLEIYSKGGGVIMIPSKRQLIDNEIDRAKNLMDGWTDADAKALLTLPTEQQREAAWQNYCRRDIENKTGGILTKMEENILRKSTKGISISPAF